MQSNKRNSHQIAINAVNAFASELYNRLESDGGNLLVSPFSIHSVLSMAWTGARGTTAEQLAKVLHWPADMQGKIGSASALGWDWSTSEAAMKIASALWAQEGHSIEPEYVNQIVHLFGGGIQAVDFREPLETSRRINHWVARQTNDRIRELVSPGSFDALTRLVLTNAIYFKDEWFDQFDRTQTNPGPFHLADGSTIDVPMMHLNENLWAIEQERFVGVELQYRSQASMLILMSRAIGDIDWLEQEVLTKGIDALSSKLHNRRVDLRTPRFRFESGFRLRATLESMGVADAFDRATADFAGITPGSDFWIADVLHKTFIDVNEEGTEAAAAEALALAGGYSEPPRPMALTIDRPFVFAITAGGIDSAVLFMGRVMLPERSPEAVQPDTQQSFSGVVPGRITEFLTVNKFKVRLRDGREIIAAMPDDLLDLVHPSRDQDGSGVAVEVALQESPLISRIVKAWRQPR